MDSVVLATPFDSAALAEAETSTLKSSLLKQIEERDTEPIAKKVRFTNETLMPLFNELEKRNPTPDLHQQIPLLKGIWLSVWSTIPFQDIIPGRVCHESYQIFDDNGYYANLARYKPGQKAPILNWIARWLLSYDLMIMQSYAVQTGASDDSNHPATPQQTSQDYWDIQNVFIQQVLRFGSPSFSAEAAQTWFNQAVANYQQRLKSQQASQQQASQQQPAMPAQSIHRVTAKQYQKIANARPQLAHLYIDQDFRLIKTQREKSQRPSYTVAIRLT